MSDDRVRITRLDRDRWRDYKKLRLESLDAEPLAFINSSEDEKDLPGEEWKRRIGTTLFGLSDDKPIDMITCVCGGKVKMRHVVDIFGVYVSRKYRGLKVRRRLLEAMLTEVRKDKNIRKPRLSINPEQKVAVRFYEGCGFEVVGRCKRELL